eukprot:comp24144_c1_seq1/m.43912 comp24144_c1_seq1/g.43912  ORF comp24144_c1_seq1/g.43912 comp24144_c1_seq1/m.43912 type:complete len:776 (-) comp24144_c1_seq1:401-2728(-)
MGKTSRAALKTVVLGPSCVGKTALVQRLVLGVFLEDYQETLEDVYNKTIVLGDGVLVDLCVVDLGGAPVGTANTWHPLLERQIAQAENADAVILCYSITNRTSLDECINVYRNVLAARGGEPVPAILVGTMLDNDHDRQVRTETAKRLNERLVVNPCPFLFMEVSSLHGKAINVFYELARVTLAYRQQNAVNAAVGPAAKRMSSSRPPTARNSVTSSSTGSGAGSTHGSDVDFDPNLTVSSRGSSRLSATPHLSSTSAESAESQDASISSGGSTRSAPLPTRSMLKRSVSTGSVNLSAMPVTRTSSGGPNPFRQSFRHSASDNRQSLAEKSSSGIITGSIRRRSSTIQRTASMRPRGFSSPQIMNNQTGPQPTPMQVVQSQPDSPPTETEEDQITEHHRSFSASDVRRQALEQPRLMRRSETAGRLTPQTPPLSDIDKRKGKSEQSLAERVKLEVESNLGTRFESVPTVAMREKLAAAMAADTVKKAQNDKEEPYMVRRKNFRKSWRHSTRALPHAFSDDLWLEVRPDEFGIREDVGTSGASDPGVPMVKSALAAVGENDAGDHSLEHLPEQPQRADMVVPRPAPRPASLGVKSAPRPVSRPISQGDSNANSPTAATTPTNSAPQVNRQSVHEGGVVDTEEVDEEELEVVGSEDSGRDIHDGENEGETSPHPSSSSSSAPVDGNTPAGSKTPKTPRLGFIGRSLLRMSTRSTKSTMSDTVETPIESTTSSDSSEPSSPEYKKHRKEKASSLLGSLKRASGKRTSGAKSEPAVVVA